MERRKPRDDSPDFPKWQEDMSKVHGIAEIMVAKQRHGPIRNVDLQFDANFTKFSDFIKKDYLPEDDFA